MANQMQVEIRHSQIAVSPAATYAFGMELSIHIRDLRKKRGLTLADLAGKVGISVPHMSEVERGKKNLNNHLMTRIAAALDTTPADLISGGEWSDLQHILQNLDEDGQAQVLQFAKALQIAASQRSK